MGRRDRPPHSRAHRRDTVARAPRHEVVLAAEAEDELVELIRYIRKDSPKNAASVLRAILERRAALRSHPLIGHVDPNAPLVPKGATARLISVKGIGLYYLFPLQRAGREIVYVVSIRRGQRMPLEQPDYARLWITEVSKVPPASPTEERG